MNKNNLLAAALGAVCLSLPSAMWTERAAQAAPNSVPTSQAPLPPPRPAKSANASDPQPGAARPATGKPEREALVPFSAAWWAREEAINERLKRTMQICRGC